MISRKLRGADDLPLLDAPRCGMSAEESALCEAAYRSRTAANLASRSAVETAVEAAVREASEFVEENATEYRKLKVLLVKAEMVRGVHSSIVTNSLLPGSIGGA